MDDVIHRTKSLCAASTSSVAKYVEFHTDTHTHTHSPPISTYRPSSISGNLEALQTMPLKHLDLYGCEKVQGTKDMVMCGRLVWACANTKVFPPLPRPP